MCNTLVRDESPFKHQSSLRQEIVSRKRLESEVALLEEAEERSI